MGLAGWLAGEDSLSDVGSRASNRSLYERIRQRRAPVAATVVLEVPTTAARQHASRSLKRALLNSKYLRNSREKLVRAAITLRLSTAPFHEVVFLCLQEEHGERFIRASLSMRCGAMRCSFSNTSARCAE